ncbi:MAG: DUF3991 and toprim domain-containing protein [Peptococcaceae bacterium]|nr:DUF3991 and toprim domain-containing protein [Peptococcaceae bacterium]
MPGVSAEQVALAKEMDLLTYLQSREPHELKRSGPNEHRTASHGSLVISHGLWYWHRGGFGGKSALDYLVKVRGMSFIEAVEVILDCRAAPAASSLPVGKSLPMARKEFILPPPARFAAHALAYLQRRGLTLKVIGPCVQSGTIYESRDHGQAVCVFVGRDETGIPRFAHMRGIYERYHRDADGSDKRFSFTLPAKNRNSTALALFEAPIDALSHACLFPEFEGSRLSLGGISDVALMAFLERNPCICEISLCLDNDGAGQTAARKIYAALTESHPNIAVSINPPETGKDYNDQLLYAIGLEREQGATNRDQDGYLIS